jgi:membrane associated rhomboid family serine protease
MPDVVWPGGLAADIWTFVTYALIHADLGHLIINGVWLLAFCSPLSRRFGTLRFIAFMAATAAAGAAVHLVTHWGELLPVIGISASISGAMAAAMRFAFQRGGPLMAWRDRDDAYRVPPRRSRRACVIRRAGVLLAWFGVNLLFGLVPFGAAGVGQAVAWQAHIGGFLAGLVAFAAFDPIPQAAEPDPLPLFIDDCGAPLRHKRRVTRVAGRAS